ncbi:FH1/FH2 domain-containing protein 3-like [Myotis lucifugus]|uniref:FH1/FH2 domain-containing protein 3-like n=1 Tax=Myotis lucifugus TaxID=59463 RepID=UPI0003C4B07B|nr:FH1/FH2 domain-containing protein 3-like [Myotis lucifugus]
MEILEEKDGVDTELLVYAMTLVNKTLSGLPDQDTFYDVVDCLEELGIAAVSQRHLNKKGTDLDLVEQLNIYEVALRHEDGDETAEPPPSGRRDRRRASLCSGGGVGEQRGLDRRRSRRHSVQSVRGPLSAPTSPCSQAAPGFKPSQVRDLREKVEVLLISFGWSIFPIMEIHLEPKVEEGIGLGVMCKTLSVLTPFSTIGL